MASENPRPLCNPGNESKAGVGEQEPREGESALEN
jgi:hypothetical protein